MTILRKILLIVGMVGLIVGVGLFFVRTEPVKGVQVQGAPFSLDKATYYTSRNAGFFEPSTDYYSQIQVQPTASAKPDIEYLIVLDNGIVSQEYVVSWSKLEIAIAKSKTITDKISQDAYTALGMRTSYTTQTYEAKSQRQILYLVAGAIILALFWLLYKLLPNGPERFAYATNPNAPTGEPISFDPSIGANAFSNSESVFADGADFLMNQRINDLIQKGVSVREAESIRRQAKPLDFVTREQFFSAIERKHRG